MKSFYAAYLAERTDDHIIEQEYGFVTYRYLNTNQVYIIDIYVLPEKRRSLLASTLADLVIVEARKKGCTELLGTIVPSTKKSTISLKVLLGYGMRLHSSSNDMIIFKKDI